MWEWDYREALDYHPEWGAYVLSEAFICEAISNTSPKHGYTLSLDAEQLDRFVHLLNLFNVQPETFYHD